MHEREKLADLQRRLYTANQRRIRRLVSCPRRFERRALDQYEQELEKSVPSDFELSTPGELRRAITSARVVLVGDYHTLRQSQRGFLGILGMQRAKRVVVGLEFVMARYQAAVDRYLAGRLDERAFLERIRYHKSWPSYRVWPNFRPIFDFCARRGYPIVALDCEPDECGTLFSRMDFMSWRLAEALRRYDARRLVALIGEAHLAPGHLPERLRQAMARLGLHGQVLVVHQNIDTVFFRLLEMGLEDSVDVVKLAEDRFVVPASSPIAAQQSFLAAVAAEPWSADPADQADVKRLFMRTLRQLANLLRVRLPEEAKEVEVYGPAAVRAVFTRVKASCPEYVGHVVEKMEAGESFYLREARMVYLADLGITHVAEEATHLLKESLASSPMPTDPVDFFLSRVLHEAIGYFGSKLFNPKRKVPRLPNPARETDETRAQRAALMRELIRGFRRLVLTGRKEKRPFELAIASAGVAVGLEDLGPEIVEPLIHHVGYDLGERLYLAYRAGRADRRSVRKLLQSDIDRPDAALEWLGRLAPVLRTVRLPRRL